MRAFGLRRLAAARFDALYSAYLRDLRRHVLRRGLLACSGSWALRSCSAAPCSRSSG